MTLNAPQGAGPGAETREPFRFRRPGKPGGAAGEHEGD